MFPRLLRILCLSACCLTIFQAPKVLAQDNFDGFLGFTCGEEDNACYDALLNALGKVSDGSINYAEGPNYDELLAWLTRPLWVPCVFRNPNCNNRPPRGFPSPRPGSSCIRECAMGTSQYDHIGGGISVGSCCTDIGPNGSADCQNSASMCRAAGGMPDPRLCQMASRRGLDTLRMGDC